MFGLCLLAYVYNRDLVAAGPLTYLGTLGFLVQVPVLLPFFARFQVYLVAQLLYHTQ